MLDCTSCVVPDAAIYYAAVCSGLCHGNQLVRTTVAELTCDFELIKIEDTPDLIRWSIRLLHGLIDIASVMICTISCWRWLLTGSNNDFAVVKEEF